jgi:hypothetical protein
MDKFTKEIIEKDSRLYNKYWLDKIDDYSMHVGFITGFITLFFLSVFLFFGIDFATIVWNAFIYYGISFILYIILAFVIALFFYSVVRLFFSTLFLMLFKKKEGIE